MRALLAVRGRQDVLLLQGGGDADGDRLLAERGGVGAEPAGALQGDRPRVEGPGEYHGPVEPDELPAVLRPVGRVALDRAVRAKDARAGDGEARHLAPAHGHSRRLVVAARPAGTLRRGPSRPDWADQAARSSSGGGRARGVSTRAGSRACPRRAASSRLGGSTTTSTGRTRARGCGRRRPSPPLDRSPSRNGSRLHRMLPRPMSLPPSPRRCYRAAQDFPNPRSYERG